MLYFEGKDGDDPLFLQVKEATASVLEPYLGRPAQTHHGQRVVARPEADAGRERRVPRLDDRARRARTYYWRQLWDAKISADLETMKPAGLLSYARVCGWALARAHARSGNPAAIAAYMGTSGRFERAMLEFSDAYADQNERDYAALRAAIESGRIQASTGI